MLRGSQEERARRCRARKRSPLLFAINYLTNAPGRYKIPPGISREYSPAIFPARVDSRPAGWKWTPLPLPRAPSHWSSRALERLPPLRGAQADAKPSATSHLPFSRNRSGSSHRVPDYVGCASHVRTEFRSPNRGAGSKNAAVREAARSSGINAQPSAGPSSVSYPPAARQRYLRQRSHQRQHRCLDD